MEINSNHKKSLLKYTLVGGGFVAAIYCAVSGFNAARLTLNTTASMPLGIYQKSSINTDDLKLNQDIMLCPIDPKKSFVMNFAVQHDWLERSPASKCPDHLVPFIKKVAALPGDSVNLDWHGITVNGKLYPKTALTILLSDMRPPPHIPLGNYEVKPGTLWVYDNNSSRAFDSRYWGPIEKSQILDGVRPVFTW